MYSARPSGPDSATINPAALNSPGESPSRLVALAVSRYVCYTTTSFPFPPALLSSHITHHITSTRSAALGCAVASVGQACYYELRLRAVSLLAPTRASPRHTLTRMAPHIMALLTCRYLSTTVAFVVGFTVLTCPRS